MPLPGGVITGRLKTNADLDEGIFFIEGEQMMGEKTTKFKGQVPLIPGIEYDFLDVKGLGLENDRVMRVLIPAVMSGCGSVVGQKTKKV